MPVTSATDALPVVDFGRWQGSEADQVALAEEVRRICHEFGFFLLVDHPIPQEFMDRVFSTMRDLFALPPEQKLLIDKRNSRHFRGWEGEGAEYTNNRPDIREQVDLWSEHTPRPRDVEPSYLRLLGPNQWYPAAFSDDVPKKGVISIDARKPTEKMPAVLPWPQPNSFRIGG